jgi:hypothetical protein
MAACSRGAYRGGRPALCLTCAPRTRSDDALWWTRFHSARAARIGRVERIEDLPAEDYGGSWYLWVRGDRLRVSAEAAARPADLPWGSVDQARRARVVLRVRDEAGRARRPPSPDAQELLPSGQPGTTLSS